MNNITAEWIDNNTLVVKWKSVQAGDGVTATYTVYYSSFMETRDGMQNVNGTARTQMSTRTQTTSVVIGQLDPTDLYQIAVEVNLKPLQNASSVGIGV